MKIRVIGCSHHNTPLEVREQLAFRPDQARAALGVLRQEFSELEIVLLSTCNRVELYTAAQHGDCPTRFQIAGFLAGHHRVDPRMVMEHLYEHAGEEAVRHLFLVACSLDSMVVGEPQILAQVKHAYTVAIEERAIGPLTHAVFQAALKVARRVAGETTIHQRRVSIPSVAVADFAQQIFERFDDKQTLVIGAGEMAEETLKYLEDRGARQVTIVNRSPRRAIELAGRWRGRVLSWEQLTEAVAAADLVVSATGASEPVITAERFRRIESLRGGRPLFILDLAVPRDFDPAIGRRRNVFLYAIDDLQQVCQRNRAERNRELPAAMKIIDDETARFLGELHHRAAGPIVARLKRDWTQIKEAELERLFHKLPALQDGSRREIDRAFERLVNKLLHPPLESLRRESHRGFPTGLLDSLTKLFRLQN